MVETKEGCFLYTGLLHDYVMEGEALEYIYLNTPVKRKIGAAEALSVVSQPGSELTDSQNTSASQSLTSQTDEEDFSVNPLKPGSPYEMDGDLLCLPFKDIRNLMLHFLQLPETTSETAIPLLTTNAEEPLLSSASQN